MLPTHSSKNGDKVGCKTILNNIKSMKQLPDKLSIYSAGVLAIDLSLEIILKKQIVIKP